MTQLTNPTTIAGAFDERAAEMGEFQGRRRCTFPKCGCVGSCTLAKNVTPPVVYEDVRKALPLVRPPVVVVRAKRSNPPASLSSTYTQFNGEPCPYCDRPMDTRSWTLAPSTDHINPTSRGGSDKPANKLVVCRGCNEAKSGRTLAEFQAYLADRRDPRAAHVQRVLDSRQTATEAAE